MISRILEPGFEGDGALSNDLLSAFYQGFPIENLRPLLRSESDAVLTTAAFLVTELGWKVHPFVAEIVDLLDHPRSRVRFDAIEALRTCTTPNDGWALGRVLLHLADPHHFVRWQAMSFIRISQRWQLDCALDHAAIERPGSVFGELRNLLRGCLAISTKHVHALIGHPNPIARRFGLGIAARPRLVVDETFLEIAEACDDEEISQRAAEFRTRLLPKDAVLSSSLTDNDDQERIR